MIFLDYEVIVKDFEFYFGYIMNILFQKESFMDDLMWFFLKEFEIEYINISFFIFIGILLGGIVKYFYNMYNVQLCNIVN